jgi:hypothetical protein
MVRGVRTRLRMHFNRLSGGEVHAKPQILFAPATPRVPNATCLVRSVRYDDVKVVARLVESQRWSCGSVRRGSDADCECAIWTAGRQGFTGSRRNAWTRSWFRVIATGLVRENT